MKAGRRYDSSRREAQAAETRRHIVEAARHLFTERGYVGTTLEAIAREAGVAVETVYAAFGSKRALLKRLVGISVWGDDQPMNPRERPGVVAVLQERDQRRQIEMFARHDRGIMERVGPLHYVMRAAEQAEPEIAALLREGLEGRRVGLMHFVRGLRSNGPLRAGLSESAAADTVWAVTSPDVHRLLTVNCGWPGDQYEHWLADTLARLLLP